MNCQKIFKLTKLLEEQDDEQLQFAMELDSYEKESPREDREKMKMNTMEEDSIEEQQHHLGQTEEINNSKEAKQEQVEQKKDEQEQVKQEQEQDKEWQRRNEQPNGPTIDLQQTGDDENKHSNEVTMSTLLDEQHNRSIISKPWRTTSTTIRRRNPIGNFER